MSVDYYLVSPLNKHGVRVGSIGFGGVQAYPGNADVVEFIKWVIEEAVGDVILVSEDTYYDLIEPPRTTDTT